MLGIGAIYAALAIALFRRLRVPQHLFHHLPNQSCSVAPSPRRLSTHLRQPPLDIGDFERAERIFGREVALKHGLELLPEDAQPLAPTVRGLVDRHTLHDDDR